ncbi:MAG: UDP-glucose 4-epimerase GalE [Lachnospiraceae bacterium]|nr:UDP-glucose 4-epimerase GalE [Lachnospiraceae bacterium]
MKILVTGGAGYIGSHTCIELIKAEYEVVIVDNLSNSSEEAVRRIEKISSCCIPFYKEDIRDKEALSSIFETERIDAVIHFAGLKAVGESVEMPMEYYNNNVYGTLCLCEVMKEFGVKNMVFSSSATVYGNPKTVPIREEFPLSATNPYGRTKLFLEQILTDIFVSDNSWNIVLLRYFNPIGAHESGLIGESPKGIPNNLMPYITQVCVGKRKELRIFGDDYDTPDGTGVRDYIHVVDLAIGHVKALDLIGRIVNGDAPERKVHIYNLGTGKGVSVLEMVHAFEKASNTKIPYTVVERRSGDIACCYADASKAKEELGFEARYDLDRMCTDSYRWQSMNPEGM